MLNIKDTIFENGRTLSDFELLAKLQHHGAATRLIDVSKIFLLPYGLPVIQCTIKLALYLDYIIQQ